MLSKYFSLIVYVNQSYKMQPHCKVLPDHFKKYCTVSVKGKH